MKVVLLIISLTISVFSKAAVVEKPSQTYPEQAVRNYGWMFDNKESLLSISMNDTAKKFITEESLNRYFKLKMRNFAKELKFLDEKEVSGLNYNYSYIKLEIFKYNDKTKIYYGLISLKMDSSVLWGGKPRVYELTKAIAGSEPQILSFIKEDIDLLVEALAEDYYYISDEQEKHNKPLKQDK
jgi:hypothetical protein